MSLIDELKQEITEKSLQAFRMGLFAGTSGNMSTYIPEQEIMLITPTSVRYETMQPRQIVEMRLNGTVPFFPRGNPAPNGTSTRRCIKHIRLCAPFSTPTVLTERLSPSIIWRFLRF